MVPRENLGRIPQREITEAPRTETARAGPMTAARPRGNKRVGRRRVTNQYAGTGPPPFSSAAQSHRNLPAALGAMPPR